jgi:hypothetical protein
VVRDDSEEEEGGGGGAGDTTNDFPLKVWYVCFIGSTVLGVSAATGLDVNGSSRMRDDDDSFPSWSTSTGILGERVGLM